MRHDLVNYFELETRSDTDRAPGLPWIGFLMGSVASLGLWVSVGSMATIFLS